jgi:hypothetical protein
MLLGVFMNMILYGVRISCYAFDWGSATDVVVAGLDLAGQFVKQRTRTLT